MGRLVGVILALASVLCLSRAARASEAGDDAARVPHTLHVGIELASLSKLELGQGTYSAEFFLTIRCDAEPCRPDLDVTNGKITGKEKLLDLPLLKELKIKADLGAFVDLSEYPFDRHRLVVSLNDKADPLNARLEIDREATRIEPDVKLAGWHIEGWSAAPRVHKIDAQNHVYELELGVDIKRPRTSAFMKTLLPVFFMVFVAGLTLLLKPKSAQARLTASTAGLMSVVMFHLSATSGLPPLGYLTRMDKLMIGTYLLYLVSIAFAVAMVRFDEKKQEKWAELSYLVSAGAVPGLALCVWALVFTRLV